MSDWFDDAFEEDCALFHEADLRMERKAAEERAQRAEARVRELEEAQGELLELVQRMEFKRGMRYRR